MRASRIFWFVGFLIVATSANSQEQIMIVTWNMESDDSDPDLLDDRIAFCNGIDLWGLSEVKSEDWTEQFETAAEDGEDARFESITGSTGRSDRLAIIYDADRFELVQTWELDKANPAGNHRAPLVAHLRFVESGNEFLFMMTHLARGNADVRLQQAEILNTWARGQTLPIICAGNMNFDWHVENGEDEHDAAYDVFTKDDVWQWVRPKKLIKTQASDRHNSVVDFIFISGSVENWRTMSGILDREEGDTENDFDDDERTTDHRPVMAMIYMR